MNERVTRENLGAWLVRCNPAVWDIVTFVEDGNDWIDEWTVQDNYRSALMRIGDPIVLWVNSPASGRVVPGVWGVGSVIGSVRAALDLADEPAGSDEYDADSNGDLDPAEVDLDYWLDLDTAQRARFSVLVDIPLLEAPLDRETLRNDVVLHGMEILRQPQMSNPSWLTHEEWGRLRRMLPEGYREDMDSTSIERAAAQDSVASLDASTTYAMSVLSMAHVMLDLQDDGWRLEEGDQVDERWDVTVSRDGVVRHVRVLGTTSHAPTVTLLPSDLSAASTVPYWELAIVTRVLAKPETHYYSAARVIASAQPVAHKLSFLDS